MRYMDVANLVEQEIRKNYHLGGEVDVIGQSANKKTISFKFDDMGIEINFKYKTKDALKILFNKRVEKGEFNNCTFDEFEELYIQGYEIEDIEPELKKKKLDFGDGKKEE